MRAYDGLDRILSETTPRGIISYGYDLAGRRTGMQASGQAATSYAYDSDNRLKQISQGTSSVSIGYDIASRKTSVTLPNGIVMSYSYDTASQLLGINYQFGNAVLGNLTYSYDLASRRTAIGGSFARTGLPQTLSSGVYNANNQITQFGAATLSYDLNGNLTSDGVNTYTWDARNHLVSITGSVSAAFQYDPFGRRVTKSIAGTTTNYLYDSMNAIEELSGGVLMASMLGGLRVDERYQRITAAGTDTYLPDAVNSTMALSNTGGTIFVNYTYEPFGNTSQSGSTTNLYQFTGRESDATGLYYYRARYYSPQLQRFFSEDPIGFLSKDTNLYSYAYTDPVDFTDANGDCPLCIVGIVGGIGGVIGAAEEGYKAYQCGAQGWNLAGAVGRGFVAGGTGAIVGLVAGFASKNPFLGGALGAATYNLVNQSLGANVSTTSAIVGTVTGGLTGMAGGEIADSVLPVRGGENFNPFTSVRTLGPKAAQLYGETGASGVLGVAGDIGTDAALAKLSGRKDSCE